MAFLGLLREEDQIGDLFQGNEQKLVTCSSCKQANPTYSPHKGPLTPFTSLSLAISNATTDLKGCLASEHVDSHVLKGWTCEEQDHGRRKG
jgi:hypothetical protein